MELDSATRKVVKKTPTAATLHTEGLMGDEFVEIAVGTTVDALLLCKIMTLWKAPVRSRFRTLIKKANGILADSASGAGQTTFRRRRVIWGR